MNKKICPICKKEYETYSAERIYCSKECQSKGRAPRLRKGKEDLMKYTGARRWETLKGDKPKGSRRIEVSEEIVKELKELWKERYIVDWKVVKIYHKINMNFGSHIYWAIRKRPDILEFFKEFPPILGLPKKIQAWPIEKMRKFLEETSKEPIRYLAREYQIGETLARGICKKFDIIPLKVTTIRWSEGAKERIALSSHNRSGKKCPHYGKPMANIHGSWHITWDGKKVWLRSSWELKYAQLLDSKKILYIVEPSVFPIHYVYKDEKIEGTYTPDFYIPSEDKYIEIKGWWRGESKEKFDAFKDSYPNLKIELLMKKEMKELGLIRW